MIAAPADFPYPGSTARYEGKNYRILRHEGAQGAVISDPDRDGSSAVRRVPLAALTDPRTERLDVRGLRPELVRALLWLDETLRGANRVVFDDLKTKVHLAAARGEAGPVDGYSLAGLLRRLGFMRDGRMRTSGGSVIIWSRREAEVF